MPTRLAILNSAEFPEEVLANLDWHGIELQRAPHAVDKEKVCALMRTDAPPTHLVMALPAAQLVRVDIETDWMCRRVSIARPDNAAIDDAVQHICECAHALNDVYGDLEDRQRLFVYITECETISKDDQRAILLRMNNGLMDLIVNWLDESRTIKFLSTEGADDFQSLLKGIASQESRFPK